MAGPKDKSDTDPADEEIKNISHGVPEDVEDYPSTFDDDDDGSGSWAVLGDGLKKAVVGGITAALTAEEGIRSAMGDMRLPKEALSYIAQQTDRSRRELFRGVSKEVKTFLTDFDVVGEVRRALVGMKLEVKAEVRFVDEQNHETSMKAAITEDPAESDTPPVKKKSRSRAPKKSPSSGTT